MATTEGTTSLDSLRIDRGGKRFSPGKKRRWPGLLLVIALIGAAGWFLRDRVPADFSVGRRSSGVRTGLAVKTRPSASLELTSASGYVVPRREASLSSRHAARLVDLVVDIGDRLAKDDIVARLEDDVWRNRRDLAAAAVREAESAAAAARTDVEVAERRVSRLERDVEQLQARVGETDTEIVEARRVLGVEERLANKGAGTTDARDKAANAVKTLVAVKKSRVASVEAMRGELELSASQREAAANRLAIAERQIESAKLRLKEAEDDLADTIVRAPFDGVVTRKEADVGEVVVPALAGGGSNRGAVVHLVDFNSLEMEVDVFERDIALIVAGRPARIFLDSRADEPFAATVRQVVPTADRSKATVQVKVSFDRVDAGVLPEMSGRVVFLKEEPSGDERPYVTVPANAVVERDGRTGVFVVVSNAARFIAVETGDRRGDRIIVSKGLSGGERVVLDPADGVVDGTELEIADD